MCGHAHRVYLVCTAQSQPYRHLPWVPPPLVSYIHIQCSPAPSRDIPLLLAQSASGCQNGPPCSRHVSLATRTGCQFESTGNYYHSRYYGRYLPPPAHSFHSLRRPTIRLLRSWLTFVCFASASVSSCRCLPRVHAHPSRPMFVMVPYFHAHTSLCHCLLHVHRP